MQARRLALASTVSALALVASTAQSRTLPTHGAEIDLSPRDARLSATLLPTGGTEVDLTTALVDFKGEPRLHDPVVSAAARETRSTAATPRDVGLTRDVDLNGPLVAHVRSRSDSGVDSELADLLDRAKSLVVEFDDIGTKTVVAPVPDAEAIDAWKSKGLREGRADDAQVWLAALGDDGDANATKASAAADDAAAVQHAKGSAPLKAQVSDVHLAEIASVDAGMLRPESDGTADVAAADAADVRTAAVPAMELQAGEAASTDGLGLIAARTATVPAMELQVGEQASTDGLGRIAADRTAPARVARKMSAPPFLPAARPARVEVEIGGAIATAEIDAKTPVAATPAKPVRAAPGTAADTAKPRNHVKNLPWLKKRAKKPAVTPTVDVATNRVDAPETTADVAAVSGNGEPTDPSPATAAAIVPLPAAAPAEPSTTATLVSTPAAAPIDAATGTDVAGTVPGAAPDEPQSEAMEALTVAAVSDDELAEMRAGFTINGFDIKFGIQAATYVNGTLRASYQFTSDDLAPITGGTSPALISGPGTATAPHIVQVGPGNDASGAFNFSGPITVIQNTLDGTLVQHVAAITVDVNGWLGGAGITTDSLSPGTSPYNLALSFGTN